MDVFELRNQLVGNYGAFARSFTKIKSANIHFCRNCGQEYYPASLEDRDGIKQVPPYEIEAYGDSAPFQHIVTTTTPPPESLQTEPYLYLTLDPSHDASLLFGRGVNAFTQAEALTPEENAP